MFVLVLVVSRSGMSGRLAVTLIKSRYGRNPPQTAALKALGLRKIRHTVLLEANAATLGNLREVRVRVASDGALIFCKQGDSFGARVRGRGRSV